MGTLSENPDGNSSVKIYNIHRTWGVHGAGPFSVINGTPVAGTAYTDINALSALPGAIFRYFVTDVSNYNANSTLLCEPSSDTITVTTPCVPFTLPFYEGFDTTLMPNCWSQVDYKGYGQIWQFGVIPGYSPAPALTGNYAFLNSHAYGENHPQNVDLISPLFDLSGYSTVTLGFKHYLRTSTATGTLSYSINNGATWNILQTFTLTTANPATFSQSIPAVAGQSQVKFKWNYTGGFDWYWAIDNVQITGMPINRELTNITV